MFHHISLFVIVFTNNILNAKITTKKLVHESVLNEKIKILKAQQDKIVKLQTHGFSLFIDQSYLNSDEAKLYVILQQLYYTVK